jgi:hypothetical protein
MSIDPVGPDVWAHPFVRCLGEIAGAVDGAAAAAPELLDAREKGRHFSIWSDSSRRWRR